MSTNLGPERLCSREIAITFSIYRYTLQIQRYIMNPQAESLALHLNEMYRCICVYKIASN